MQLIFPTEGYKHMPNKIEDKTVFSTCLIGDRAKKDDELSFFTVPRGQHMQQIPLDATRCSACQQPSMRTLGETDTNLMQCGQFGSAIGDARLDKIHAELSGGDPVVLEAEIVLRIAGKRMLETTLEKLVAGWVPLEDEVQTVEHMQDAKTVPVKVPYVLAARTDTVEARLRLTRDTKIVGDPISVKLTLVGKFSADREAIHELIRAR